MRENIEKTIKNLEKNNISAYFVKTKGEIVPIIEKLVEKDAMVAWGGSVTLKEAGVIEHLKSGRYRYLDRDAEGLTRDQVMDIFRQSFGADAYFCSSNAVTEEGELYNVDGNANRISAIAFGPKKVIMVVGTNKIVPDIDSAVKRVKTIAAPKNCKRLSCDTYCFQKGHCIDVEGGIGKGCESPARICRHYLVSAKQAQKDRINVIIVDEELGY